MAHRMRYHFPPVSATMDGERNVPGYHHSEEIMKQQLIVTAVGAPALEALSESERGIFCEMLLRRITALAEREQPHAA